MKRPNDYENTQDGSFIPVELGGHTAKIKRVEDTVSSTGKPMIKVAIDFDAADGQGDYFMKAFNADTRDGKKWPYQGTQYIVAEDSFGKCTRNFKQFITCVEKSNNSECVWGDGFEKWFTGKKIGVVFGEVEEEYNGDIKTRRRIRWFCQYDKAKDAPIPEKKLLERSGFVNPNPAGDSLNGFINNMADVADEEIPF